jgi:hypothetical protein
MSVPLQFRRGLAADRPTLNVGEPALDLDPGSPQMWLGTVDGNQRIWPQTIPGAAAIDGTPVAGQIGVWASALDIGGHPDFRWDTNRLIFGTSALCTWDGQSRISSPGDGLLLLTDAAGTDWSRLAFGGTSGSYPALARVGQELHAQLASGAANTLVEMSTTRFSELGAAPTHTADHGLLYVLTDHDLYFKDQGGVEVNISAAAEALSGSSLTLEAITIQNTADAFVTIETSAAASWSAAKYRNTSLPKEWRVGAEPTSGDYVVRDASQGLVRQRVSTSDGYSWFEGILLEAGEKLIVDADEDSYFINTADDELELFLGGASCVAWTVAETTFSGTVTAEEVLLGGTTPELYFGGKTSDEVKLRRSGKALFLLEADSTTTYANFYARSVFTVGGFFQTANAFGGNRGYRFDGTSARIYSSGTNNIAFTDTATTDFGALLLGGETSSYPSVKRSGADIHIRLADDTDYTGLRAARTDITPPTLTDAGADDRAFSLEQTLNDTVAYAGGETYTANHMDITATDTSGWENTYLANWKVGGDSKFQVGLNGYTITGGNLLVGGTSQGIAFDASTQANWVYVRINSDAGAFGALRASAFTSDGQIWAKTQLVLGSGAQFLAKWYDGSGTDTTHIASSGSNSVVFVGFPNNSKDHDHGPQTNPTLFIHSATDPNTDNTQWVSFAHDQTDAILESGAGDIVFDSATGVARITGAAATLHLGELGSSPYFFRSGDNAVTLERASGSNLATLTLNSVELLGNVRSITSGNERPRYRVSTGGQFEINPGTNNRRSLVLCAFANNNADYGHALQANPTLFVHSATVAGTATDEWLGTTHDQNHGLLTTGKGDLLCRPASGRLAIGDTSGSTGVVLDAETAANTIYFRRLTDNAIATTLRAEYFSTTATAGGIIVGSSGFYRFDSRSVIKGATNGQLTFQNSAAASGVTFDFSASDICKVRNRLDTDYAAVETGDMDVHGGSDDQVLQIRTATALLSDVSTDATADSLIPAGAVVVGVTARVTTLITGATSFDIGDGTDVDAFGAGIAVAAGTTANNTDWTIGTAPVYASATNVVLTPNGGAFSAGAVRLTVHYFMPVAPAS